MTIEETKTYLTLKYGSVLAYFDLWLIDKVAPKPNELECFNAMLDDGTLFNEISYSEYNQ